MRLITIAFLVLSFPVSSCQNNNKYQAQLNTVDTLIKALYNNDRQKVGCLTGVNPEDIGEDREDFKFKVRGANEILQEYGMSKMKTYEIKEYPGQTQDLIEVTVPLYKKDGSKTEGKIIVRFVRFLPPSQIAYFLIHTEPDGLIPILAVPERSDTTKGDSTNRDLNK